MENLVLLAIVGLIVWGLYKLANRSSAPPEGSLTVEELKSRFGRIVQGWQFAQIQAWKSNSNFMVGLAVSNQGNSIVIHRFMESRPGSRIFVSTGEFTLEKGERIEVKGKSFNQQTRQYYYNGQSASYNYGERVISGAHIVIHKESGHLISLADYPVANGEVDAANAAATLRQVLGNSEAAVSSASAPKGIESIDASVDRAATTRREPPSEVGGSAPAGFDL
ncbi:MAG TPA: hypothetical protein VI168_03310 [Croceibacterium sp.]